jgi:hypothetical protein
MVLSGIRVRRHHLQPHALSTLALPCQRDALPLRLPQASSGTLRQIADCDLRLEPRKVGFEASVILWGKCSPRVAAVLGYGLVP